MTDKTQTTTISTEELVDLVRLSVISINGYPIDAFNIQEEICSRLLASEGNIRDHNFVAGYPNEPN